MIHDGQYSTGGREGRTIGAGSRGRTLREHVKKMTDFEGREGIPPSEGATPEGTKRTGEIQSLIASRETDE